MKKKILILGGAGFVGHNLALKLSKLNYIVSVVDALHVNNLISVLSDEDKLPYPELSQKIVFERINILKKNKINFLIQDIRDYHALSEIFRKIKPNVIIHLSP